MNKIMCPRCHGKLSIEDNYVWVNHQNSYWWKCGCGWGVQDGMYNFCEGKPEELEWLKARRWKHRYGFTVLSRIRNRIRVALDGWAYKRTEREYFPTIYIKGTSVGLKVERKD